MRASIPLLAFVLGTAACSANSPPEESPSRARAPATRYRLDLEPEEHRLGGREALVTIVVFSDYACPPCARTWKVLEHLVEDYGEDLQVVFRSMSQPGFADAEQAAEAALAAGAQGKFWPMHARLYAEMRFDRAALQEHAEALGLDVPRFLDDLDAGVFAGTRIRHRRQALELGIYFSPVALVNGVPVIGFREEAAWHALIDEEIVQAQARVREGVGRGQVYAELMREAQVSPIVVDAQFEAQRRVLAERFKAAEAPPPRQAEEGKRYAVGAGEAPTRGPADAPVLLVAFMDLECPFCLKAQEGIEALLRRYPADLRVAFRHLPLPVHAGAESAARAAIAADLQGHFWAFAGRLFTTGSGPGFTTGSGPGSTTGSGPDFAAPRHGRQTYAQIARELGLDERRFLTDFDSSEVAGVVRDDLVVARRLGLDATPALFLNGRYISGFRGTEELAADIDAELALARQRIAGGVARDAVVREILEREAIQAGEFPNAELQQGFPP